MSRREKIEKIMDSLDLGFSDVYKGENVRQLTLMSEKLDIIQEAVEFVTIEETMNFSIFSTRGSKHPTAEIYAIDFPSDLRASIYLLLGGYYRQAILCLRNWLEIRLARARARATVESERLSVRLLSKAYSAVRNFTRSIRRWDCVNS